MTFLGAVARLTESQFMMQLVSRNKRKPGLATLLGWKSWHDAATNAPRACPSCKAVLHFPRNDPGWPDLFLLRGDTLIVVELKADRGRETPEQRSTLAAFRQVRRILVTTWRPRDLDLIQKILR